MKKAIIKTKTITAGLIIILIMGFIQSPFAAPKTQDPLEFVFIGKLTDGPLFQLNVNNPEDGKFLIRVKDADGNLLYSEKLEGKNLSRKYQLFVATEELYDAFNVRFEITSVKTHETQVYKITNNSRTVHDMIVGRL